MVIKRLRHAKSANGLTRISSLTLTEVLKVYEKAITASQPRRPMRASEVRSNLYPCVESPGIITVFNNLSDERSC